MKKQLLCTSAIALGCAVAAPASAQDWDMNWGGFMNQHVAYSDVSTPLAPLATWDGEGIDLNSNTEIIFSPSVTLDNGMTFGINVQFEGNNGFSVDESYMSISSDSFGRLDIGSENSAGYKLMVGAPGVTSMYINSPSTSTFLPFTGTGTAMAFRQAGQSSYTEVGGNNDVLRLTYYTPDFNGLTVGVSYAPNNAVNAGNSYSFITGGPLATAAVAGLLPVSGATLSDIFDIGANFSTSFGTTDLTLAARWGTANQTRNFVGLGDPETWGVGFNVTFSNVTVGGSWAENDNGGLLGAGDQEGWSLGATYDTGGPWSFEALTYQGEIDGGLVTALEREAYRIGASRDLGPGVDWDIYVVYEERDVPATALTEIDGTIIGTAINLSF